MTSTTQVRNMKYTNKHNLPDPVVRALTSYDGDQSVEGLRVTTLIDSPRVSQLRRRHSHEITEDVSSLMWRVLGTAIHDIFERAASNAYISEERLSHTVNGTLISGAIDYQFENEGEIDLKDYKCTSAYKLLVGSFSDWEKQLNVYAFLIRKEKNLKVKSASAVVLLRDWRQAEADRRRDYPQSSITEVPINLWSDDDQDAYVMKRVRIHNMAELGAEFDDLPDCTDEERWGRAAQYAVMKTGGKRALKVFNSQEEADTHIKNDDTRYVEVRAAVYSRCAGNYCRVSEFCSQWKGEQRT
jgi:hypothetical protein